MAVRSDKLLTDEEVAREIASIEKELINNPSILEMLGDRQWDYPTT